MKKLTKLINMISIILTIISFTLLWLRTGYFICDLISIFLFLISSIPHELLHALFFKKDVYMYQNIKQGMLFVTGVEDLSKSRFILMSLFPNLLFGFLPIIIFMINPSLKILGMLGAFSIGAGAGDYLNVYNALTQVPNGAKIYNSGMHSY